MASQSSKSCSKTERIDSAMNVALLKLGIIIETTGGGII
jgi:hypothetical protein